MNDDLFELRSEMTVATVTWMNIVRGEMNEDVGVDVLETVAAAEMATRLRYICEMFRDPIHEDRLQLEACEQ